MTLALVIAGTGTDVGKTVFAAALTSAMGGVYWKPVQAGTNGETDSEAVRRLAALRPDKILPEAYRLRLAASPHHAAACEGIEISPHRLTLPQTEAPLVIEAAGGLAVPLTNTLLQIDMIALWQRPVILVAATALGTINHSLLSIEALKARRIAILGIAFVGDDNAASQSAICTFGGVKHLGRLPYLELLTPSTLRAAFAANFNVADILGLAGSP